jgi:hypothetical protein
MVWWQRQAAGGMGWRQGGFSGVFEVLEFPCIFSFHATERGDSGERKNKDDERHLGTQGMGDNIRRLMN